MGAPYVSTRHAAIEIEQEGKRSDVTVTLVVSGQDDSCVRKVLNGVMNETVKTMRYLSVDTKSDKRCRSATLRTRR